MSDHSRCEHETYQEEFTCEELQTLRARLAVAENEVQRLVTAPTGLSLALNEAKVSDVFRARAEAAEAEVERLRGLRPELAPIPPGGEGLPRYGIRWNGPTKPLSVPMADGYWTPWHLAAPAVPTHFCEKCGWVGVEVNGQHPGCNYSALPLTTPGGEECLACALVERGFIVIRIPVDALPVAYRAAVDLGYIEPGFKITDARAFAKEVVCALNGEDERGTTAIHRMMDAACEEAIEQGAEGVEEDSACNGTGQAPRGKK